MAPASEFLLSSQPRARWMRFDTAHILKRFFFCERALLLGEATWIPSLAPLEIKIDLARFVWQSAETANALRERVFELRFPSRLLEEEGSDGALIELFSGAKNAPSGAAFLHCLGTVLLPALGDAYREYLDLSDEIADGPTHRFLALALAEKEKHIRAIERAAESAMSSSPDSRHEAVAWAHEVARR